jgi:TRAP-type C4-dicarboxylate transport system substrate-binding protein
MVSVTLDAWNALEPETQAAIEDVAARLEGQFWLNSRAEDAKKIATLKEHGMEVVSPTPELQASLMEKALPLWEEFKARVPDAAPVIDSYLAARD